MKKLLCVLLGLILVLTVFAGCNDVSNTVSENSESITDTEHQETESENVLVESPESDFEYELINEISENIKITKYVGNSKNVVIPSKIGEYCVTSLNGFQDTTVETVVIPATVRVIGAGAFEACSKLTTVIIPLNSQLLTIQNGAFKDCSALRSISIDNAEELKVIEERAFRNCASIEKIKFPNKLETIGKYAFDNCSSLESINIPTKLQMMNPDGASFYNVPALKEIMFDDGWENIRGYVFFTITSTVTITVPKSVKSIYATTFANGGTMNMIFLGDCPQILEADRFAGNTVIYYDPSTNGWDTTPLIQAHTLIPF